MKPKQQTKQQLMELNLKLADDLRDVKHDLAAVQHDNDRYIGVVAKLNKSLDRFTIAVIVGTIFGFAVGLYTGHKITQRATPEPVKYGSVKLEDIVVTNLVHHIETAAPHITVVMELLPEPAQPKYRQIQHTKGAEMLRL